MEAMMTQDDTRDALGFGAALARQFSFLWSSRRPLLMAVGVLAFLVLAGEPWTEDAKMRLLTLWPLWLIFIGPVWAFAVFYKEGPDDRHYFWAQPVDRAAHALARIAAGVAWLWIIMAVLILAGWLFALGDGEAWQMAEIGAAGWINLFTGPLIGYLLVSILTIPSDYPIRWFLGIVFLVPLTISIMVEWLEVEDAVERTFQWLINEDWGLGITLVGGLGRAVERLEHTIRAVGNPSYQGSPNLDYGEAWATATPLWLLLIGGIVAFIATRHPDRLPSWTDLKARFQRGA